MADIRHPRPLLRKLVGEVLRRHRQDQGRTLAEVAREANVSVPYLSEVERGRKEPSSEILAAVCDSLGVGLADLLAEVRLELMTATVPVLRLHTNLQHQHHQAPPPVHRPGDTYLLAA